LRESERWGKAEWDTVSGERSSGEEWTGGAKPKKGARQDSVKRESEIGRHEVNLMVVRNKLGI